MGKDVVIEGSVSVGDCCAIADGVIIGGEVRLGDRVQIEKHAQLTGNVQIGDDTLIGSFSILSTTRDGRLIIGKDVLVNSFSVIGSSARVEIGDHCIFAAYVQITDATHGIRDPGKLTKHADFETAPVRIEENVWLGSAAMVMMGVTIGRGAVIGAKALVTDDIPALSIAYGLPARVVRTREVA